MCALFWCIVCGLCIFQCNECKQTVALKKTKTIFDLDGYFYKLLFCFIKVYEQIFFFFYVEIDIYSLICFRCY